MSASKQTIILTVGVNSADRLPHQGNLPPYVKVFVDDQETDAQTKPSYAFYPHWHRRFEFELDTIPQTISFEMKGYRPVSPDTTIGRCTLTLDKLALPDAFQSGPLVVKDGDVDLKGPNDHFGGTLNVCVLACTLEQHQAFLAERQVHYEKQEDKVHPEADASRKFHVVKGQHMDVKGQNLANVCFDHEHQGKTRTLDNEPILVEKAHILGKHPVHKAM